MAARSQQNSPYASQCLWAQGCNAIETGWERTFWGSQTPKSHTSSSFSGPAGCAKAGQAPCLKWDRRHWDQSPPELKCCFSNRNTQGNDQIHCSSAHNCSMGMSGWPMPCRKARLVSYQPFLDFSKPVSSDRATELHSKIPAQKPLREAQQGGGSSKAGKSTAAGLRRGYRDSTAGKYLWRKDAELCMFPRLEMVLIYLLQRLWLFAAGFCWKQLFEAHLLPLVTQLCIWARTKHPLNSHKLQGILLFFSPLEKRKPFL